MWPVCIYSMECGHRIKFSFWSDRLLFSASFSLPGITCQLVVCCPSNSRYSRTSHTKKQAFSSQIRGCSLYEVIQQEEPQLQITDDLLESSLSEVPVSSSDRSLLSQIDSIWSVLVQTLLSTRSS